MIRVRVIHVLTVIISCICCGIADHNSIESNCLNFVNDCNAQPDSDIDNTFAFTLCQNKLQTGNGGCVFVPKGKYYVYNAELNTSNIIFYINSSVTFLPYITSSTKKSYPVFVLGSQTKFVKNVSLIGTATPYTTSISPSTSPSTWKNASPVAKSNFNDNFLIDIRNNSISPWNVRGIQVLGIDGFVLANINIKIHANLSTEKSGLQFAHNNVNDIIYHGKNGQILNLNASDYMGGYGAVQMQSGENIIFENIDGTGGITLRLEPGAGDQNGYVNNITGNNIICRNGHAAFMSQPHTQQNGVYKIYNMVSYSCYIGAELNGGYSQQNKPPGHFSNDSIVHGVVSYWGTHAQIFKQGNYTRTGPSCGPCGNENSKLNYIVTVTGLKSVGFPAPSNRDKCLYWKRHPFPTVCPWDNSSISIDRDYIH